MHETQRRGTILVIEDDPGCSDLISEVIQDLGFDVAVHDRARDALSLITQREPLLLVLDVMLPDGDGLAILRALRADERLRSLPVLLCTAALFEIEGPRRPPSDPFTKIVAKPFHIASFALALTSLLEEPATMA